MLSHTLVTLYRTLARHRLFAALNVLGLAAGIAVFLVLTLIVQYESGFDRWLPDANNIYRLDSTWTFPGDAPYEDADSTFVAMQPLLADYPQIRAATRMMPRSRPVSVGATIASESVAYVDANFLNVVRLQLAEGDRDQALSNPSSVAITATTAQKYFGTTKALGRTLTISEDGTKRSLTVTAILQDLPHDTTLSPINLITRFTPSIEQATRAFTNWGSASGYTYVKFANRTDARSVQADLQSFVARRSADAKGRPEGGLSLSLVALTDAHFHDVTVDAPIPGVDRRVVFSLAAIGLLALVMAAINYVNLATARSDLRAREVALRKVMGATRRMLLLHFLAEAMAMVAVAALIGLALTELAVPVVNALGGWAVRINYAQTVPLVLILVILLGGVAGFYPAILLAAYRPALVLASSRTPSGGRMGTRLRGLLVLIQFVGAISFAICTLVIDRQSAFLRDAGRGFDRNGLIIVESLQAPELVSRQNVILDAFRRVPGVVAVTQSNREPDSEDSSTTNVGRPGLIGPEPHFIYETVGRDYFHTYGVRLLAGRLFDGAHRNDDLGGIPWDDRSFNTVINETGVAALKFRSPEDAVGQTMTGDSHARMTIIGVVADVRFMSPRDPIAPQYYMYNSHGFADAQAAIRSQGVARAEMMQRLQTAWRTLLPDVPFVADTADGRLSGFYKPDEQRARLFSAGAILAVGIACLGLYGLASFSTTRRIKEIGIRKTLGASTRDVLALLIFQFVRPVLIANLIAWPLAWGAMRGFLAGFDQRIPLSPLYFIAVGLGALGLAIVTVLSQAVSVARAEPARALRYE